MPTELYCEWCGNGPFKNMGSKRSHKARHCKKRPASESPSTIEPEGTDDPPAADPALDGQRSAPVFEQPPAPPAYPPPPNREPPPAMTPDEMERRIQAIVEARVQALMATAEQRLGSMMQQSLSLVEETCNKLPGIVEQQVHGLLGGGEPVVIDQSGNPAPPPVQTAKAPAPAGPLGSLFTPEILELVAKFLGAEDTSIGSIFAAIMKKSQQSQKKTEPLNASMMTRGAGHMISMLKNKRIDPVAMAKVTIANAEDVLKMPNIDGSTKSYWLGKKGEATGYLASLLLEKDDRPGDGGTPALEAT